MSELTDCIAHCRKRRHAARVIANAVLFFIVLVLISASQAYAQDGNCDAGSALDQYQCFDRRLRVVDADIAQAIERADATIKSEWGEKGTEEMRGHLRAGQGAWESYREDTCAFDYYTHAPVHPPSQSVSITTCKLRMGNARLAEIRNLYLNQE